MTEDEARTWLQAKLDVSRETVERLTAYAALVEEGQETQNLVSANTLATFWSRHIVDSAQLILWAGQGSWLDIGSGAGLPGLVTAILTGTPTTLVEPRARRAVFLHETAEKLGLLNVTVAATPVQKLVCKPVGNITARAVATLPSLIQMAIPFAHSDTVWLLPKGKNAQSELALLSPAWQGDWQLLSSVTDPESRILVGRHIKVNNKP